MPDEHVPMRDEMHRIEGETDVDFAARLREAASRLRRAWGADVERKRLLERADRVERGEE